MCDVWKLHSPSVDTFDARVKVPSGVLARWSVAWEGIRARVTLAHGIDDESSWKDTYRSMVASHGFIGRTRAFGEPGQEGRSCSMVGTYWKEPLPN